MGTRGPRPTPANIIRLTTGTAPRRATTDLGDVQPPVEVPDPPENLSAEAAAEWRRITPLLSELKLIAQIDRAALVLYVSAWGRLMIVETALAAEQARLLDAGADPTGALVMTTPSGYAREAILSRLAGELGQQVDRYLGSFGMSPASRSRVTASRNDGQAELPGMEAGPARFFTAGR